MKVSYNIKDPQDLQKTSEIYTDILMSQNDPLAMQRGDYGRYIPATFFFTVGRALTGPVQYLLIKAHPLARFGIPPPPTDGVISVLGHYTLPRLPFLTALMPGLLSAKHILWLNLLCREKMTMQFAFFAVLADLIYETVTSLVFTASAVNPLFSKRMFYVGTTVYFASVALELIAELQRASFKAEPENKGKLCKTGLWGISRHINYTANVLFGLGYGLATGGPLYSIMTAGMYVSNFATNAIPGLEDYCRAKYGDDWKLYEKEVPWKLIPGVY